MIKINCFVFFFLFLITGTALSESSADLYKKVFGKSLETKKISIDATLGGFFLGQVQVEILGEKIQKISGADLNQVLKNVLREEKIKFYHLENVDLLLKQLPFKITYHPMELRLSIDIPNNDLKPHDQNVFDDLVPYYFKKAVSPTGLSFGTNYKIEEVMTHHLDQLGYRSGQIDSFVHYKNSTIVNQMNYLSSRDASWYRQESKLIYDGLNNMQRLELGDINYPVMGFQQSNSLGGISFYRDFSINPYSRTNPTSSFEYVVDSRSLIRTYVNNTLLKTEYLNPGRYTVKDIPLNNGINKILIEMTDEFQRKKVLHFNQAGSLDLLAPTISRYSLGFGYPAVDTEIKKKYKKDDGVFATGFFQHGLFKEWTLGAYGQGNKNFNLLGVDNIWATNYGNWSMDFGKSKNNFKTGTAFTLTYQLNLFGAYWYDSHHLNTKTEYRSLGFNESGHTVVNRYDYQVSASYSVPFFEKFNVSLGGNYQNPRAGNISKYGFDSSFTSKISDSTYLTFFYARAKGEDKLWNTQLYCFLNFTFKDSPTYASLFYEKNSQTKRMTVINDDGKKVESLKVAASVDTNRATRNGSLDLQYNTTLADLGIREEAINNKGGGTGYKTSLRFLSAFAFVYNQDESAFAISRPIANSFVIFKPNSNWSKQRFLVQAGGENHETGSGLFGESLVSGLTSYQYRRLQLDPQYLEPGHVLGQESFVVYPHFKSGQVFVVGETGALVLRGILVDKKNRPLTLKVGFWISSDGNRSIPFFTNREGEFLIEGVIPSAGKLQIDDDQFKSLEINLSDKKNGLIEMGKMVLPYNENKI